VSVVSFIKWRMSLELSEVTKDFGAFRLWPFNVTIQRGEFFSLLGPSGCGKTTALRLIGGFETPSSGKILLDGQDITLLPPHKRNVHTVFQRYALFPHLNVFENVAFSLRLKRVPTREIQPRVSEALKLVEIESLSGRSIQQLSGGQSQRVALARALVDRPQVLLLDEPLSALDPALRLRMREELKALCRKVGSTFLLVTHDQEEALQLSDRIAVLQNGRCLQIGSPKAIYEDPADPFVASFIGPTNEIAGEISGESESQWVMRSAVGVFRLKKNDVNLPKEISLILRPEKMRLLRAKSSVSENLIEGQIQEVSYLGSRTEYIVKKDVTTFKVFEQELDRSKKKLLTIGDRVFLTWKTEDAMIFPRNVTLSAPPTTAGESSPTLPATPAIEAGISA
jgi:spermidine/putrescine transport system ATP-binding protein